MICDTADDQVVAPHLPKLSKYQQPLFPPLSCCLPQSSFPATRNASTSRRCLQRARCRKCVQLIGCEEEEQAESSRSGSICGGNSPDGVVHAGASASSWLPTRAQFGSTKLQLH